MPKTLITSFLFNDFSRDIRVYKENISFIKLGYRAQIVATSGRDLPSLETIDGIEVIRIKIPRINFMPIQLIAYWAKTIFTYRNAQIMHCNDLYTLPIGAAIKLLFNRKAKIVYDCPAYETDAGIFINKPLLKLFARGAERLLIKSANKVITVSESIAEAYSNKYKIQKPALVMNCLPYNEYTRHNIFREKLNISQSTKIFLYQGEFSKDKVKGVDIILNAFDETGKELNFAIIFLGYGTYFNEYSRKFSDTTTIFFYPAVSTSEYMEHVCSADVGLHILEATCLNNEYAMPNKIFDYIAARLPVIVSGLKEMKALVENTKIGFVLKQNSKDSLKEVLRTIKSLDLEVYQGNLYAAYQVFNWENQEKVLGSVYNSLYK